MPNPMTSIRRWLKSFVGIRRRYHDLDIVLKYGQLLPQRVPLARSPHSLYADPREERGRAMLRGYGAGQPHLKAVWSRAISALSPSLVLDVGANYGELTFLPTYRPETKVLSIEADPSLVPYLERSRSAHPAASQIHIVNALASASDGEQVPFYVDDAWSGRSSALRRSTSGLTAKNVRTRSVDALISELQLDPASLVFKIDVEGYEPNVLNGMGQTLKQAKKAIGLIELNGTFLAQLGVSIGPYLEELRERFSVIALDHDGSTREMDALLRAGPELVTDLIVSTREDWFHQLVR